MTTSLVVIWSVVIVEISIKKWTQHVICIGKQYMHTKFQFENVKGRDHTTVDGLTTFKRAKK
jgi:hypothetical protein